MNFSCCALFHVKTRVSLKYFVSYCRFFFGVLIEVGGTIDLFTKSYFGDVQIVFLLRVLTICYLKLALEKKLLLNMFFTSILFYFI